MGSDRRSYSACSFKGRINGNRQRESVRLLKGQISNPRSGKMSTIKTANSFNPRGLPNVQGNPEHLPLERWSFSGGVRSIADAGSRIGWVPGNHEANLALPVSSLARRGVRARAVGSKPQGGRYAAASLLSFFRRGEIYRTMTRASGSMPGRPFDDRPRPHSKNGFPSGYSLADCTPSEPAATSPAGAHIARKRLRGLTHFQRTTNSVLTVCLTLGDNPMLFRGGYV